MLLPLATTATESGAVLAKRNWSHHECYSHDHKLHIPCRRRSYLAIRAFAIGSLARLILRVDCGSNLKVKRINKRVTTKKKRDKLLRGGGGR